MRRIIATLVICAGLWTLLGFKSGGAKAQSPGIKFWAYSSGTPFRGAPNAHVLISADAGVREIGRTDEAGEITVANALLSAPSARVILFCRDESGITCAAIRLDTSVLRGFQQFNVQVPTLIVIDRHSVGPRH